MKRTPPRPFRAIAPATTSLICSSHQLYQGTPAFKIMSKREENSIYVTLITSSTECRQFHFLCQISNLV
jgi:hypothetical protein